MNMMKTFVPLLKTEYGASDGGRERSCSTLSGEDTNPAAGGGVAVNFSMVCSTAVSGPLSLSRELWFACIIRQDGVSSWKVYHENENTVDEELGD